MPAITIEELAVDIANFRKQAAEAKSTVESGQRVMAQAAGAIVACEMIIERIKKAEHEAREAEAELAASEDGKKAT